MQMSQHPKMGPFSGLLAMANWTRVRGNFSFMLMLNRKLFKVLSEAHCFLAELQGTGVYPPIIFPNSVYNKTTVPATPSHFLWNSLTENAFSEALKIRLTSDILSSKKVEMTLSSRIILLLKPAGDLIQDKLKGIDFSRLGVLRQIYDILSIFYSASFCTSNTSFSVMVGSGILLALKSSLRIGLRQAPVKCSKSCSLILFTNFIISKLYPQVLTQYLNFECYVLILFKSQINRPSMRSLIGWKSGKQTLGL